MKKMIFAAALVCATAVSAYAQTTTVPATDGETPAVATPDTTNTTAPVEGANSFTEAQAKERIEAAGYTGLTGLKLDEKGVWQATAMKDGKSMSARLILILLPISPPSRAWMLVVPLVMLCRSISTTMTKLTPSRCMPSGVGWPWRSGRASIRN